LNPPRDWINEARVKKNTEGYCVLKKQFKQIAAENGFSHEALFTRFCEKLEATPTELGKRWKRLKKRQKETNEELQL